MATTTTTSSVPRAPARKPVAKRTLRPVARAASVVQAAEPPKPAMPELAGRGAKAGKVKLVRDSFTMPADEYAQIAALKQRALASAHPAKKSELLRAGIKVLASLEDAALIEVLTGLPAIKTGRPKSGKGD